MRVLGENGRECVSVFFWLEWLDEGAHINFCVRILEAFKEFGL